MKKEIIKGNKLIAKFMGATFKTVDYYGNGKLTDEIIFKKHPDLQITSMGRVFSNFTYLAYHSSWDWMMPVIDKIVSLNPKKGKEWYYYSISHGHCRIYGNTPFGISGEWKNNSDTTINAVWKTVIEFIKSYNEKFSAVPQKEIA